MSYIYVPLSLKYGRFYGCTEEEYCAIATSMSFDPDEIIKNCGNSISVLQDYIYDANISRFEDYFTADEVFNDKRDALQEVMSFAQAIDQNRFLKLEYLSIMAQTCFMMGDWANALLYYEEMLAFPGVLDCEYSESYYTGELELASKIVHNMCVIYSCQNDYSRAHAIMGKYGYIFALEKQRTTRLIKNNPELCEGFSKEWEQLSNVSNTSCFYFDGCLDSCLVSSGGMLFACYQDAVRNGEPYKVSLDMVLHVCQSECNVFEIIDKEHWDDDKRVMEVNLLL